MVEKTVLEDKSLDVAARVTELCRYLREEKNEFTVSEQLLKSGTGISANIQEAMNMQGNEDYSSKMFTALRAVIGTLYWTDRLRATGYLSPEQKEGVWSVCKELENILFSIVYDQ